jgi:hypothetical protein
MHHIYILTLSVRDHLSSHGMALGFSWLGYPVPGVSHTQNSFYNLHSNNKKHKKHNKHKIQANKQHYNSYMHSVGRRRLLNLQASHMYRLAWAVRGIFHKDQLSKIGFSWHQKSWQREKQVSASRVLYLTRCLASKLVFGSTDLVLGSSMALIPPETISIFLEGKIHRYDL